MYFFIIICNYLYQFPQQREETPCLVSERAELLAWPKPRHHQRVHSVSCVSWVMFHAPVTTFCAGSHVSRRQCWCRARHRRGLTGRRVQGRRSAPRGPVPWA